MENDLKKKILAWIYENHNHHSTECRCPESDYPYVNSLKLEDFIKSFDSKDNKKWGPVPPSKVPGTPRY